MAQAENGRLPAAKNLADILDSGTEELFRSRRFRRRQRLTSMCECESVLPDVLPCFNFRRFRAHMGRFINDGVGRTRGIRLFCGGPPRAFGPLRSRLPGLDPHTLLRTALPGRISRGGSIQGQFSFRRISGGNRLCLRSPILAAPFFLQQLFDASSRPAGPGPGGILDPVAAIVISLPMLGGFPELAPQALCAVIQPSTDKLFRRCLDFLFQTFLFLTLFLDFFDILSPHVSRNRAVSQTPTARFLLKIYILYCFQHHSAIFAINSSGSGSRYGIRMVPLLVSYSDSLSRNLSTASGPG